MVQKKTRGKGEGSLFKDGRGLWTVAIELPAHDGVRRRKVIRSKDKKVVLEKLAALKADLKLRHDLPTSDQTVATWFTYWYENIVLKEVRPKTAAGYKTVIFKHIIPELGRVKLERVTNAHVRQIHDRIIIDKGLTSTYALNVHRVLSSGLNSALEDGKIGRNPAKSVHAPRKEPLNLEALDQNEGIHVLEFLSKDKERGPRWATSLLTGGRRGEVIGLERNRVTDVLDLSWQLQRLKLTDIEGKPQAPVDFEYRHLVGGLYLTRPKSSAGWRIIPLVDPLKAILEAYIAATPDNEYGLVFLAANGRPHDPDQDSNNWRSILKETGITKDVRLHDLRHTAVDLLYLAGVAEDLIPEIVGHADKKMSRKYKSRSNMARLRGAMEQFSSMFKQIES